MINIFRLSSGLRQKMDKHLTFITYFSIMCFCFTFFFLYYFFYDEMIWYVYGFWGIGGLIVTRKTWPEVFTVIVDWPFFLWICLFVYIFALYYHLNDYKYSTNEFFYNDKFDDYNNKNKNKL